MTVSKNHGRYVLASLGLVIMGPVNCVPLKTGQGRFYV